MASRLRILLDAVGLAATEGSRAAGEGGGQAVLRQTQRAVQSIVPALKEHGAESGIGAQFVVQVIVQQWIILFM